MTASPAARDDAEVAEPRLIVDGNNVMGSRPDGWWRDRAGAARRLVAEIGAWAAEPVLVVFDGRAPDPPPAAEGVEVRYAGGGGRDAADHVIAAARRRRRGPARAARGHVRRGAGRPRARARRGGAGGRRVPRRAQSRLSLTMRTIVLTT